MPMQQAAEMTRESLVSQTFIQLADTLVADFDIIDLLTMLADRCVELVDADACAILLADGDDSLRVVAASSEQARLLELFQLQNEEGPCVEAYSSGTAIIHTELREALDRWPRFTPYVVGAGFETVYALPLRLRDTTIGAVNLFRAAPGPMPDADVRLAQALADVASVAILQDQASRQTQSRAGQLQHAFESRIIVEQAKGVLSERAHIDMSTAFDRLREHARINKLGLTAVAAEVVTGSLTVEDLTVKQRIPRAR